MILTVDVGNTNTVFGVGRPTSDDFSPVIRLATHAVDTADDWAARLFPALERAGIFPDAIRGLAVASVVPDATKAIVELGARAFKVEPFVVSASLDLGISISVDDPSEVGTDRLANAVAAFELFGGPSIVVDLGTATKVESISESGVFRGGVIAPGIGVALSALASRAARLYAVELTPPASVIGKSTITAVQAGVVTGHAVMIEGLVGRMIEETEAPAHVIVTGGYASILGDSLPIATDIRPDLTLIGIRRIYARHHHR
jgi:type III pantothenate kinase